MSNCKGVVKTECLPPGCSWADGQTRKYCRAKHNKAKSAKKSPKARKAKSPRMPRLLPPTPSAIERFVRETGIQMTPPRVKTPKSKKVKKAKTPKAKGVEHWKVTYVKIWFAQEEDNDEDNESVFNIESVTMTGPKHQKVVYSFKDKTVIMNDEAAHEQKLGSYKLSAVLQKEALVSVGSFKLDMETDDLASIHDSTYGLKKRGIKITSKPKVMKEHIAAGLQDMLN